MKETTDLQETQKFEIQTYERPKDSKLLRVTHVSFSGSPRKHPHDPDKVILIVDPYSTNTFYYEFRAEDVDFLEELPNIVNLEGASMAMVRLWVKKQSIAVRCTPFVVQETGLTAKKF